MIGNNQDTKRRGSGNKSEHVLKEKKKASGNWHWLEWPRWKPEAGPAEGALDSSCWWRALEATREEEVGKIELKDNERDPVRVGEGFHLDEHSLFLISGWKIKDEEYIGLSQLHACLHARGKQYIYIYILKENTNTKGCAPGRPLCRHWRQHVRFC